MRVEFMNKKGVSLSTDVLAVIDTSNNKFIHIFDIFSGKAGTNPIEHSTEVVEIGLNQQTASNDLKLAFVDNNKDFWLISVH